MTALHIQKLDKTSLLEFSSVVYRFARRAVSAYSSKFSKKTYTRHQHIAIICLKVRECDTYKEVVEMLVEMPRIREALDLKKTFLFPLCFQLVATFQEPEQNASGDREKVIILS